jgi:uncharacterized protein YjiS (DUF1127 family)
MTNIDTQITTQVAVQPQISLREVAKAAIDGISTMINTLLDWQARARERRELLGLGDRALQDFGASRADAAAEGDKPFWRA